MITYDHLEHGRKNTNRKESESSTIESNMYALDFSRFDAHGRNCTAGGNVERRKYDDRGL